MNSSTYNTDKPVNGYRCANGHTMIVRDVDHGTTPMLLQCRICEAQGRTGFAESMGYAVPANWWEQAQWEMYRPANIKHFAPPMQAHIRRGGLVLRKVGDPDESLPVHV